MVVTEDNLSYWEAEYNREMDSYYRIKQTCNHGNYVEDILRRWDSASRAFDRASEINKAIKKYKDSLK